jgi:hypothetical protein
MATKSGKQILVRELVARGLHAMAGKAQKGDYSDFASPYPAPIVELVRQA